MSRKASRRSGSQTRVSIIGRGKVGRALGAALKFAGVDVSLVRARRKTPFPSLAPTVIVCVSDDAIAATARALAPRLAGDSVVLHCAGARSPEELASCRMAGAAVATFHPLASFADARHPPDFRLCTFVAAGDARALRTARSLSRTLGARFTVADLSDATYHAAAAMLANGTVALAFAAKAALLEVGVPARTAERALSGLLRSVADNVAELGVPAALTGPVSRGDAATVARHVAALRARVPEHAASYLALQPALARAARAQRQK